MLRAVKGIEYDLKQTTRKNLLLRVELSGRVVCLAPKGIRLREADAFVLSKREWIEESRTKMQMVKESAEKRNDMTPNSIMLRGKAVRVEASVGKNETVRVAEDVLFVTAREDSPDRVREVVRAFLIDEAVSALEARMDHYVPLIGREPNHIAVREQKTKWGSCSSQGNIAFNWKLIMAPPQALDYVVIHELCHLYEFDHSPAFWKRVERYQRDYAVWKKWLKDNGSVLHV